jgi:hypothetical protein
MGKALRSKGKALWSKGTTLWGKGMTFLFKGARNAGTVPAAASRSAADGRGRQRELAAQRLAGPVRVGGGACVAHASTRPRRRPPLVRVSCATVSACALRVGLCWGATPGFARLSAALMRTTGPV